MTNVHSLYTLIRMKRDKNFVYLDTFVWDTDKNEKNKCAHNLSFETASRIFNDPLLYIEYDKTNSEVHNEHREKMIGTFDGITILTVSMTEIDEKIRIFSARKATSKEVRIYEQNAKNLQSD